MNFLIPTGEQVAGTLRVDIQAATTWQAGNAETGGLFSGERATGLQFADVAVSIPPKACARLAKCNGLNVAPGIR